MRGLPIYSDDIAYNGLYGLLPRQYMGTEFVERVEVLRGANAFLNGAAPGGSGLGGAINIVPKRATNEPLNEVTAGVRSGGQYYTAGDFSRRFADDRIGMRLNMARRDGTPPLTVNLASCRCWRWALTTRTVCAFRLIWATEA
ncbi:hypothetical protein UMZ34_09645 [Halopseudomonas pachastrellae]|nr:hypothetical protein UMZ34_09645 [Halopseudomonas pachastrellae]